ncbi:MAG TPA: peptide chain release factor 2 [Candidatus Wallbacteria bacterium]|nr:peptide chain release factor 2 [Candidatus Wallbacteria bacterium]
MKTSIITTKLENIADIKTDIANIDTAFSDIRSVFRSKEAATDIARLEELAAQPDFWANRENSTQTLKSLNQLRPRLALFTEITSLHENIHLTFELMQSENDNSLLADLLDTMKKSAQKMSEFEISLLLDEKFDANSAIISIHPGAGGTESQDWAQMLMRMYTRWMEEHKFKYSIIDQLPGEEAGIKSVTILVNGLYAYGYLKSEKGVHRLVRISPFDANHRRHTSFASVDVLPQIEESEEIVIEEKDLKIDTYRSSGAGGQHVNVTDSAVRITHLPTGTIVQCQNERSQFSNKATAMKILQSKLAELSARKRQDEIDKVNGLKREIAWGSQIRSYTFHPYNLIKDHRTAYETGNVGPVMDGYIDEFVKNYLHFLKSSN